MVDAYEVIIPASGLGTRFGGDKLTAKVGGTRVIDRTVQLFLQDHRCQRIILVVHDDNQFPWLKGIKKIIMVRGGTTRFASVKAGFQATKAEIVLIHDAARPFLSQAVLNQILKADFAFGSVVIPLRDSIAVNREGYLSYLNRDELLLIQTPQFFHRQYLMAGYETASGNERDELSFVQGHFPTVKPTLILGERANFKITYPEDI